MLRKKEIDAGKVLDEALDEALSISGSHKEPAAASAPAPAKRPKERLRGFKWKGVLADSVSLIRKTAFVTLAVLSVTLAFTQTGFLNLDLGVKSAYIVVLLLPIALGSLLLGTFAGTLLGFLSGAFLLAHAILMPLDYYELTFVTPFTSVCMLALSGLLLGLLFSLALRNNPTKIRRVVYLCLPCILVSIVYTFGFTGNAIATVLEETISNAVAAGGTDEVNITDHAIRSVLSLGEIDVQAFFDAILMAVLCVLADAIARRELGRTETIGLRPLFGACLSIVVLIVFMVTSAVSFTSVTIGELSEASEDMTGEVSYVLTQLSQSDARAQSLLDLLDSLNVADKITDDKYITDFINSVSSDSLLWGYSEYEDGLVLVSAGDTLILSDAYRLSDFTNLSDCFGEEDVIDEIHKSVETGQVRRVVYDARINSKTTSLNVNLENSTTYDVDMKIGYLLADTKDGYTVTTLRPSNMVFAERSGVMGWIALSTLILLLVVYELSSYLLNRLVGKRIDATNAVLGRITEGDLHAKVSDDGTIEFKSLSTGINTTVDTLRGWIKEAETRMDAELATAKAIQEAALPSIFPPYPDILRFDIYASMNPAREVGGDFYDFFLIGEGSGPESGKLGFVIADVSGKGVPAALFMMKAKTQIRDYMESGMELGEAIENANRQMCDGNSSGMFVTVWAGALDYATGHIDYVNAGHNPPLLWTKNGWEWLKKRSGLPLGLFDGMPYRAHSIDCAIGDQLLLYTDGVTEAMSVDEELYGEQRLENVANAYYLLHPRELVETVRQDVASHALGAEQSDDITVLSLEVGVPPEVTATLVVSDRLDELDRVNKFIHTELDRRLCPLRAQSQLDIAIEELFVNVANYAYPDATPDDPGTVRVSYTYSAEPPSIRVDIVDQGVPFNPLAKPDAVTPDDIMEVPIGGLGILMAKRSVDEMSYERVDDTNVVTIIKKW